MHVPTRSRRRSTRLSAALAGAALAALAACSGDPSSPDKPNLPSDPPLSPAIKRAAFIFDVNTARRDVKITIPEGITASIGQLGGVGMPSGSASDGTGGPSTDGPVLSLVGGDVISLAVAPGSYTASGVGTGGAPAGKVLVKFSVQMTNLLSSVQLIKPTFPIPPSSSIDAIYMFPFSTTVTTTSGSASGSGNDVIVELPNNGNVAPSSDFDGDGTAALDGSPWNFFNDTGCLAGSNDCYRFEAFSAPLAALGTSSARQIGFVIDPTVSNFRARIIVAADLQNSGAASTFSISGSVTSPQVGPIVGATVSATGDGNTTTSSTGGYSLTNVGPGPHTVSVSLPAAYTNAPNNCSTPLSQNVTLGPNATVNFSVICNAPVGSVTGNITFKAGSATPSLVGVTVRATPNAAGTGPSNANPAAGGAYSIPGVAVGVGAGAGAGVITLLNLPAGCSIDASGPAQGGSTYTGLTQGGSVGASPNYVLDCGAPPAAQYQLLASWSSVSGGHATLTVSIDMSTLNHAGNNGAAADGLSAWQIDNLTFNTTRLSSPNCTGGTSWAGGFSVFSPGSGLLNLASFNSTSGGILGLQTLFTCDFLVTGNSPANLLISWPDDPATVLDGPSSFDARPHTLRTINPLP